MNFIQTAIGHLDPPTQAELARVCGQFPQAINRWVSTGKAPPQHCIAIESATGGKVTRYELRPDVFGPAPANQERAA